MFGKIQPTILNCDHTFDENCIKNLYICPLCRCPITLKIKNYALDSITNELQLNNSANILDNLAIIF